MNNTDFGILLNQKKWKEAKEYAFSFWHGTSEKQRRLIMEMLEELLKEKAGGD